MYRIANLEGFSDIVFRASIVAITIYAILLVTLIEMALGQSLSGEPVKGRKHDVVERRCVDLVQDDLRRQKSLVSGERGRFVIGHRHRTTSSSCNFDGESMNTPPDIDTRSPAHQTTQLEHTL